MEAPVRDFHHPYKPYDIQIKLMNAVYDCIAESKIGIFESPTGTGKSLSLICGSLSWLRDVQNETLQIEVTAKEENGEPSWVVEHAQTQTMNSRIEQRLELEARLRKIRAKELRQRQRYENGEPKAKRMKTEIVRPTLGSDPEAHFELDEYESEEEDTKQKQLNNHLGDQGLSSASMQLMEKLGLVFQTSTEENDLAPTDELKIYFCSRTHSQLTQFVQEVRRVHLPPASWTMKADAPTGEELDGQVVKHVPLGSRKNLCINPSVAKLAGAPAINERCLELQQPDTPKDHKCPFIPSRENEIYVNDFRDHTIAQIRDIEDLATLGKKIGICPYYASRATVKPAEVNLLADMNIHGNELLIGKRSSRYPTHCSCRNLRERLSTSR